jgi:hypothetical protein
VKTLTDPNDRALAEYAWQMTHTDSAAFTAESQQLADRFSAELAAALAGETVEVAPLSDNSASIEWSCATGVTFYIDHSTDLDHWTCTGPFESSSNQFQTTLSGLPSAKARFFRIVCEP